jgi:hypothetical protein
MSGFAKGKKREEAGRQESSKLLNAGEFGSASRFGKRRERPEIELLEVLNTGSASVTHRTPRSVSPPLD